MAVKATQIGSSWIAASLLVLSSRPVHALQRLALTVGPDFPHILTGELDLIYSPRWTLGINAGGFAYTFQTTPNTTPASIEAANVRVRWFPFQGTFFMGIAAGFQKVAASQAQTFTINVSGTNVAIPAGASVGLNSPYLTPHLGWFVITRPGFTFAFELGAQLAANSTSNIDITVNDPTLSQYVSQVEALPAYQKLQTDIQDKIATIGNHWLPYLALRIGWTF